MWQPGGRRRERREQEGERGGERHEGEEGIILWSDVFDPHPVCHGGQTQIRGGRKWATLSCDSADMCIRSPRLGLLYWHCSLGCRGQCCRPPDGCRGFAPSGYATTQMEGASCTQQLGHSVVTYTTHSVNWRRREGSLATTVGDRVDAEWAGRRGGEAVHERVGGDGRQGGKAEAVHGRYDSCPSAEAAVSMNCIRLPTHCSSSQLLCPPPPPFPPCPAPPQNLCLKSPLRKPFPPPSPQGCRACRSAWCTAHQDCLGSTAPQGR